MEPAVLVSTIGVLIGVLFLIWFTFRGYSPILIAPICVLIIAVTSSLTFTDTLTNFYSSGFGTMAKNVLFIYLNSCMFAQILNETKSSVVLANYLVKIFGTKHAPMVIMTISGVMAFAGMSIGAYLIIYPIALVMFEKENFSEDLVLGCILAGAWTFTLASPFAPSEHNAMAMQILGTTTSAGLVPGLAAGVFMYVTIAIYLEWQGRRWRSKGRIFTERGRQFMTSTTPEEGEHYPNIFVAVLPAVVVIVSFNVFALKLPLALILGSLTCTALNFKKYDLKGWAQCYQRGLENGVIPLLFVCLRGGIGGVVAQTPFYLAVINWCSTTTLSPYVLALIGGNLMAFALGSASGATSTLLTNIKPLYEQFVMTRGVDMGDLHRLTVLGTIGLDSLPHNGTILAMCKMFNTDHKHSYFPCFITSVIIPIVAGFCVALPLALLGFK